MILGLIGFNLLHGLEGMKVLSLPLLLILCAAAGDGQSFQPNNFGFKLTSERGGPPSNAQFVPIPVVDIPPFSGPKKPASGKRPKVGKPPPPPPITTPVKPTRRPRPPPPTGFVAPQALPKPVPVNQSLPHSQSSSSSKVPPLPPNVSVVTPMTEVRPDLETVVTSAETPTTTPNTRDHLPALYYRHVQNDDLSYYFDFLAANSIKRNEQGFFKKDAVFENPIHVKTGEYSFTSPEGVPFRVDFIADERGYRTFMRSP